MFLYISFAGEDIPFVLDGPEELCIKAIQLCKQNFRFNRASAVVESDRVYLEAFPKANSKLRRLYIYNDAVILETDTQFPEEIDATKELLAFEKGCSPTEIQCVEV